MDFKVQAALASPEFPKNIITSAIKKVAIENIWDFIPKTNLRYIEAYSQMMKVDLIKGFYGIHAYLLMILLFLVAEVFIILLNNVSK